MNNFSGLDLVKPLRRAIDAEGYAAPTPIQAQSIPHLLAGRDLLGVAQTGTGKTAAFVLPMLQRLEASANGSPASGRPRALVLAPTRELAVQIGDSVRAYGKFMGLKYVNIFGGAPIGKQISTLNRGVDIVVATPGRLVDLLNQKKLRLSEVEVFVLDEADRMLDMGFINDVRKISDLVGSNRQTLLFSATMPNAVEKLAAGMLSDPVRIEVAPQSTTAERVQQRVLFVEKQQKRGLLSAILKDDTISRALVFSRTKHGADKVARYLEKGNVSAGVIHGNKSQNARQKALKGFKNGNLRVLVATDIAARGIDVDGVTHVINFDLPQDPETYVHRIGRTARAGADGQAISFCDLTERDFLFDIEKVTRNTVEVDADHPFHAPEIANAEPSGSKAARKSRNGGGRNGGGGRPPRASKGGKRFKPGGQKGHRHGQRRGNSRAA
ncbi:MAG: DEAD/DEAH box helicase [Rhodospirillaceae bacterium]|jgi:ATP-dependent RNA helicase RhlE|nr:DEAD/DEAH box helicase [Rhodospirillaceae bacterium]MBT4219130.1 DEAD/DEAH box helicase [Rhodospirillaceae bacterium]MBT4464351.1 DEAD/DEAH box helicase [Rhodospirillaceae bacterium]MBT5014036.1 DEAD/DEAH box helicase [Rhodospirillaceae bacterium]MBT5309674.1 DEAD/DEAH box helicase [Rhodospirillaceae bacterium]